MNRLEMDVLEDIDSKWGHWKALFSSIDSRVSWRQVRVRTETLPWISQVTMRACEYHCTKDKWTKTTEDGEKHY